MERTMPTRSGLLVALAFLTAACSSSDTSAPEEWVRTSAETPEDAASLSKTYGIELGAGEPTSIEPKDVDVPPDVTTQGRFGPVFTWPVIPLHVTLLPDGRVLGFGSGANGQQGTQKYAVWNPTQGTGASAFTTLSNTTSTNIFCSGGVVIPKTGDVLVVGGDRTINGQTNYGVADVNLYRTATTALERQSSSMAYRRWYPSVVTLRDGTQAILGGRDDKDFAGTDTVPPTTATYATTPELYVPGQGFRTLTGAKSAAAFGKTDAQWNYPRAFLGPWGELFIAGFGGKTWWFDAAGTGSVSPVTLRWTALPKSAPSLPTLLYAPGKLLSLGYGPKAFTVDLTQATPYPEMTAPPSQMREWANATVQADGHVFVNGGSTVYNEMTGVSYRSETWDPETGAWTPGALATRARLYHSVSMLLPDATILTAAGGAPGPQTNANGEIYYPPYLFKRDGSDTLAPRPVIQSAPANALGWSQAFTIGVSAGTAVSRVTLIRTSTVTHAYNSEQRLIELPFAQNGQTVSLTTPAFAEDAPPGYYLLFVFDAAGVPSVAKVLRLMDTGSGLPAPRPPPGPPPPTESTVVYDGTTQAFSVVLGNVNTDCDQCAAGVNAPLVTAADGTAAIRLKLKTVNYATGAFLRAPAYLGTRDFTNLHLAVLPTDATLKFRVEVGDRYPGYTQHGPVGNVVISGLTPNQWNAVTIPMTRYADAPFNYVAIKSADALGTAVFYVDSIRLEP